MIERAHVAETSSAHVIPALRRRGFQALFAGACFDMVVHSMAAIFTPLYLGALGASPARVGLVIGISAFAYPAIILSAGSLIGRMEPRRLILGTRAFVALGLLWAALAQTWWQVAPALILIAAGSLAYPAVSHAIADLTSPEERSRAFALVYGVGSYLALILAPALGGFVASSLSLRWIYIAALILEVGSLICFTGIQPQSAAATERTTATYRDAVAYRPILALSSFLLVANIVLMIGFALLPTFLHDFRGFSVSTIGRLGSLSGVGGMLLTFFFSRSRRRIGVGTPLVFTLVFVPFALALLAISPELWVIALASCLGGSYVMLWPMVDAAVGSVAPERLRARSFALAEVTGGLGVAVGPMIAGILYDVGPRIPLVACLAGTVLILLPATLLLRGYLDRARTAIEHEEMLAATVTS